MTVLTMVSKLFFINNLKGGSMYGVLHGVVGKHPFWIGPPVLFIKN